MKGNDPESSAPTPRQPARLNLVPPPSHLGDLSHIPSGERAGLVYQDGLRRLAEELIRAEADALRRVFWVAGLGTAGFVAGFGASFIPRQIPSSWFTLVVDIIIFMGLTGALLCGFAVLFFGLRWLMAMVRRRGIIRTLSTRAPGG